MIPVRPPVVNTTLFIGAKDLTGRTVSDFRSSIGLPRVKPES